MTLIALIATPKASGNAEKPLLFPKASYAENIDVLVPPYKPSVSPKTPRSEVLVANVVSSSSEDFYTTLAKIERNPLMDKIRLEFQATPEMFEIVRCESQFRQLKENGEPLISPTQDVGITQINQVHWPRAKELGLDIFYSADDNIRMAKIVLKEQGLEAWSCS